MHASRHKLNQKIIIRTGDTVFYKYDRELGFWGKPNIEKYVLFSATNTKKEIYVSHNNEGNRDCNYESKGLSENLESVRPSKNNFFYG